MSVETKHPEQDQGDQDSRWSSGSACVAVKDQAHLLDVPSMDDMHSLRAASNERALDSPPSRGDQDDMMVHQITEEDTLGQSTIQYSKYVPDSPVNPHNLSRSLCELCCIHAVNLHHTAWPASLDIPKHTRDSAPSSCTFC
jgi:hypothetical protein